MIHTIVPLSLVLPREVPQAKEVSVTGRLVRAVMVDGVYHISQVISSEPMDFLMSGISPGTAIERL